MILSLLCSNATANSYWNLSLNDNGQNSKNETHEKSPAEREHEAYLNDLYLGYFIAIVPGFYLHGLGNMYAGNWGRGLGILAVEITSIFGVFLWGLSYLDENSETKADGLGYFSVALFFASWLWDVGTVGGQVGKRHPNQVSVYCGPLPSNATQYNSPVFGVSLTFSF